MTTRVEPLWFVSCPACTLARHYDTEAAAERVAEEHDKPGVCPGQAPWVDKNPAAPGRTARRRDPPPRVSAGGAQ